MGLRLPHSYQTSRPDAPTAKAHHGRHAHGTRRQPIRGDSLAWHPCSPRQGGGPLRTHALCTADRTPTCTKARPAPQLNADALNIPPYNVLASWESWTALERGHNLRARVVRYAQTVGPKAHTGPPGRSASSTSHGGMENVHYYQVKITPRPPVRSWDLEAVDSMIARDMDLPDCPRPVPPDGPPDPLTTIVSDRAGTWHPGHALYYLWRQTKPRWQHTKEWSAT